MRLAVADAEAALRLYVDLHNIRHASDQICSDIMRLTNQEKKKHTLIRDS